jgi:hypothetical protein
MERPARDPDALCLRLVAVEIVFDLTSDVLPTCGWRIVISLATGHVTLVLFRRFGEGQVQGKVCNTTDASVPDSQRGLLIGFTHRNVTFTTNIFDPGQAWLSVVLSLGYSF